MHKMKYLALLFLLGTALSATPMSVHAEEIIDTGQETESVENESPPIIKENEDEVTPPFNEKETSEGETPPVNETTKPPTDEASTNEGVDLNVDSEFNKEKQFKIEKEELSSIPADLNLGIPSNLVLEKQENGKYGLNQLIKVTVDENSDSEYEVILKLKSTEVRYTEVDNPNNYVEGTASINGSDSFTWTAEDISKGVEVPLVIEVDAPEFGGNYKTNFSFSIDIYRLTKVEVQSDEPVEEQPEELPEEQPEELPEELPEEQLEEEEQQNSEEDTSSTENTDTYILVDESSITAETFTDYPHLKVIDISASVESIDSDAFDSLEELETINFDGTEEEWNTIFTGNLSGVEINFLKTSEDDEEVIEEEEKIVPEEPISEEPTPENEPDSEESTSTEPVSGESNSNEQESESSVSDNDLVDEPTNEANDEPTVNTAETSQE